ncbi:MAG: UvrD-helicase domain-containing protein [Nitrospinota bacterium]|nr:UvrD-helicase domain-containing protein [Nitrospinota bacterium]
MSGTQNEIQFQSAQRQEAPSEGGGEDKLNDRQMEAVNLTEGPLLIIAGAGSGKTRVITHRIAKLLSSGVRPSQMLALTFTNKAAAEMKQRTMRLCGQGGGGMWISTFHSACLRILRQEADRINYPRDFAVYDQLDQARLIKAVLQELNLPEKEHPARQIGSMISRYKSHMKGPDEAAAELGQQHRQFVEIFQRYQEKLAAAKCMDFDDLLGKLVHLLANDQETREKYQRRFQHALVDEFQDTNAAQYRLLRLIMGKNQNVCVVGDDDQSIYQWRGASLENLRNFERDYPTAKVIMLEQNYRSTGNILRSANAVVARNPGRRGKSLWTNNSQGSKVELIVAGDEREEGGEVAERILGMEAAGESLNEMAVFYRTNSQSRAVEDSLRVVGLPHQVFGGLKFYARKEVKDLLTYFNVAMNPHDLVGFRRVVNTPPRGIGQVTVNKLEEFARSEGLAPAQALDELGSIEGLSSAARAKLGEFREILRKVALLVTEKEAPDAISGALEVTGYADWLVNDNKSESISRMENLDELVNAAAEFAEKTGDSSMRAFLDQAALVADADNVNDAQGRGAVKLMTVHVSKGLEFDHVFVTGLEDNLFPHARSKDDPTQMEEERRLMYVAMTRARKSLAITRALTRRLLGVSQANRPSAFLDDLPEDALKRSGTPQKQATVYQERTEYTARTWQPELVPAKWPSAKREESVNKEVDGLSIGMKVRHPTFEIGVIRKIEGKGDKAKISIYFPRFGTKKLVRKFANISAMD